MDIEDLLATVTAQLLPMRGPQSLRSTIEVAICRRLGARWARLQTRDDHHAFPVGIDDGPGAVRVPILACTGRSRLELVVMADPERPLGEVERRFLEHIAPLCALAVEIDARGKRQLRDDGRVRDGVAPLIGRSPAMRALRDRIERVAATDFTVLIEGESGSGKELVAHQIHDLSRRCRGPFVAVNCAALVETLLEAELFGIEDRTATGVRGRRGKFELATGGTLFLDEVADLSMSAQAKLLRAIQDLTIERVGGRGSHRVDIRLVVATNKRLRELVDRGAFREDLFYRLSGVDVGVPPLRSRRDDVADLARYFLERHHSVRPLTISPVALDAMTAYDWPGNVRELERMVEAALTMAPGPVVELDDLPGPLRDPYLDVLQPSWQQRHSLREFGRRYARLVFQRCGENKRESCRLLGITYHTLQTHLHHETQRSCREVDTGVDDLPRALRGAPMGPQRLGRSAARTRAATG
jgi:DNA-binding NtrC family response regulator